MVSLYLLSTPPVNITVASFIVLSTNCVMASVFLYIIKSTTENKTSVAVLLDWVGIKFTYLSSAIIKLRY